MVIKKPAFYEKPGIYFAAIEPASSNIAAPVSGMKLKERINISSMA